MTARSSGHHIKRLERRMRHLDERIRTNAAGNLSFDRAERAALQFAIEHLRGCARVEQPVSANQLSVTETMDRIDDVMLRVLAAAYYMTVRDDYTLLEEWSDEGENAPLQTLLLGILLQTKHPATAAMLVARSAAFHGPRLLPALHDVRSWVVTGDVDGPISEELQAVSDELDADDCDECDDDGPDDPEPPEPPPGGIEQQVRDVLAETLATAGATS